MSANKSKQAPQRAQKEIDRSSRAANSQLGFILSPRKRWLMIGVFAALILSLWTYDRVFANGGALDSSFGSGSGTVITEFGMSGEAYAMALQADGKIVVAGRSRSDSDANHNAIALARYNFDGELDPTFGNGGRA